MCMRMCFVYVSFFFCLSLYFVTSVFMVFVSVYGCLCNYLFAINCIVYKRNENSTSALLSEKKIFRYANKFASLGEVMTRG